MRKPEFTFHRFRYVEVEGWPVELAPEAIRAMAVHTGMRRTGWFSTSHELVNRLHENTVWSMRGNFVGLPTDCPQRDERLDWTGDLNAFAPTAAFRRVEVRWTIENGTAKLEVTVPQRATALVEPPLHPDGVGAVQEAGPGRHVWEYAAPLRSRPNCAILRSTCQAAGLDNCYAALRWMHANVSDIDLFYAEDVDYARRLREAGVSPLAL